MRPQPLKGKVWRLVDAPWDVDEEERAFDFRDVKSAVQGLLEEIERKKEDVDISLSKILEGKKKEADEIFRKYARSVI